MPSKRPFRTHPSALALAAAGILLFSLSGIEAWQDDDPAITNRDREEKQNKAEKRVNTTLVIGTAEDIIDLPGSGAVLTSDDLARHAYDDANQALRQVPGVYLRPEDGYGFFPNISLRGVDTTRSAKVTLLEDGVLTAPAAYSAPAAYYSPTLGRMSAIEVLMGSSQTRYGPHTTGGVINYRSTEIPESRSTYIKTLYGSNNEHRTHAYIGDTFESEKWGRFGVLLEGYLRSSDGFKRIDTTPDFQNGNDTGFSKTEPMLKLSWEPKTDRYSRFELKLGYTDFKGNEGYTGLTEEDYAADPYRRYAGSRFDQMNSEHSRSYLRHFYELSSEAMVTTTVYYNKFHRDWFKLKDVRLPADPPNEWKSISHTLAGGGAHLGVLRGEAVGDLRVRHNNRNYRSCGIDSVVSHGHNLMGCENHANVGIRYHIDNARRFQTDELFTQAANGTITDRNPGAPGDAGDRDQTSKALAIYAENEIEISDKLSVTPGIRWETVDKHYWEAESTTGDGRLNLLAGGIGATYDYTEQLSFFGGIHQGYSVPGPRSAIRDDLKEETSLGFEIGPRYREKTGLWAVDATLFLTDFNDLLVIDNIGGTGAGNTENVGEARATGIELSIEADGSRFFKLPFTNPWFATLTLTDATLSNDSDSADAESIFAGGIKGNKVPYIPDLAFNIGTGFEQGKFGFYINGAYMDEMFSSASNTTDLVDASGTPDSRFGKTESYFLLDLSARYRMSDAVTVFPGVQNALDDHYLVTRHPHGARPGQPLFAYIGLEIALGSE